MDNPEEIIQKARVFFESDSRILLAVLFGSRASGMQRPDSDLDVGIAGHSVFAKDTLAEISSALESYLDVPVDLLDLKAVLGLMLLYVPEPLVVEDSAQRKDTLAIPRSVLRESLVNAVCHRDYSISTRRIQVYIFKDRIEIRSPGRIANSLTLEMIRWGNSAPRNMFLVKLMDNLRYIDGLGRGIPLMIRLMGSRVSFFEEGDTFKVVLFYA